MLFSYFAGTNTFVMTRLLSVLTVFSIVLLAISCKKTPDAAEGPGGTAPDPDYTEIPAAAPVSSKLMVYAVGNDQYTNPYSVSLNTSALDHTSDYNAFRTAGTVSLDQYTSTIVVRPQLTARYEGYTPYKTFTASGAAKNYVNAKLLPLTHAGSVSYASGSGTLALPNNGELVLPPYSLGQHSGPVSLSVLAGYTAPAVPDYAVTLPCYPMADENGKRWFLNSYGVYLLSPWVSDYTLFNVDFNPEANVLLRFPVPANQPGAPDSIPVWNINAKNLWQRNGYAVRVGHYYEKKITRKGYWNFAIPVPGVYTTFHLKSSTGFGLPNVRYIIKAGGAEVAEGRTDANGDGTVFVPAHQELTIDLVNDHPLGGGAKILDRPFGNFSKASTITLALPARHDVISLQGNVFDCDGSALANGYAGLRTFLSNDEYLFPVSNGKFQAAQWIGVGGYIRTTLNLYNSAGSSLISHPVIVSSASPTYYHYDANYYTCLNSPQLYCNYRIDTSGYKITGTINSAAPELYSKPVNTVDTRIHLSDNGKGVRFNVWFASGGAYVSVNNLEVNGVSVSLDPASGKSEIYLYRNDATVGGFREGWFNIYYKDAAGSPHTITGNFRIKIS